MHGLIALVVAALVTTATLTLTLPWLTRQVLDVPNHRSSHKTPVPRGGGIAVVLGAVAGIGAGQALAVRDVLVVVIAMLCLAVVGLLDDFGSVPVVRRLVLQLLVAVALCLLVIRPQVWSDWVLIAGSALVVIGYTNAFNFMDGINAISSLSIIVCGLWYAGLGLKYDFDAATVAGLAMAGAAAAFLPWNAPRAKVFLGDVGSYGLGIASIGLGLTLWWHAAPLLAVAAPLAIYVADTGWALGKRIVGGRDWQQAHREHVYQRVVDAGWSHLATAVLITAFSLAECALWILGGNWHESFVVASGLAITVAYLSVPTLLQRAATSARP